MYNSLSSAITDNFKVIKIEPSHYQKSCQHKHPQNDSNSPLSNSGTVNAFSTVPKLPNSLRLFGNIHVYENMVFFEHPLQATQYHDPPVRQEDDIKTFSFKSRKRFFEFFASLNYSRYGVPLFVSCTYHFDYSSDRKSLKYFLKKFYQNLKYKLPPFDLIWKLEYQKRGAPHFHFGLFPKSKSDNFDCDSIKNYIVRAWLKLKACKCPACTIFSCDVRVMKDYSHAMIYMSKEFCKLQDRYEDHDLGRVWGHSNSMPQDCLYTFPCSVSDYHKFIDVKLKEPFLSSDTFHYIQGIKYLEQNSSLFIKWTDVLHLVRAIINKPTIPSITTKHYKLKYLSKHS